MKNDQATPFPLTAGVLGRWRCRAALLACALGLAGLAAAPAVRAAAAGFKVLHQFSALTSRGLYLEAALVRGTDGNFYGTANAGGAYNQGTVFKITPAGALTVLYNFGGGDGIEPSGGLLLGSDGNFYGTTYHGGGIDNGTVFKITPAGVLTTLHEFNGDDGYYPACVLAAGSDGNFYGTTKYGGANGSGTVFRMTPAGTVTTLHSFSASDSDQTPNADGSEPFAGLVLGRDGNFYGTTAYGGTAGSGTVFKITTAGKLTSLHSFTAIDDNFVNADGSNPEAALLQGTDGNFYGTTIIGGSGRAGTVFKITPAGTLTTFHPFTATEDTDPNNLGGEPEGSLIQASDGNFYGTTSAGGDGNSGTVFKLTPAGTFTLLHSFTPANANGDNADGSNILASLVQGSDGNFYGTADTGGTAGYGTIFKMTPAGVFTLLHTCNFDNVDGAASSAKLLQSADGEYYGTASSGGTNNNGTVFKITAAGALTTLHDFTATDVNENNADGATPNGGLIYGTDGNYYGTTQNGGAHHAGAVFKMTPTGVVTNVHSFGAVGSNGTNTDGAYPFASVAQGRDGAFYGTTTGGGSGATGTVFKVTAAGTFTLLHSFGPYTNSDGASSDGAFPEAALVQGSDGNFYGTANKGGSGEYGTVFKITPAGEFTNLYAFPFVPQGSGNATTGHSPESGLVQGNDGAFYGTTSQGGANANGTVFKITAAGALTSLHSFTALTDDFPIYDNPDGAVPVGTLLKRSDGSFYGTTSQGGTYGNGTVYEMTPAGVVTTLHSFAETNSDAPTNADGAFSLAGVVQGSDGNLYGTTYNNGVNGNGTIFAVTFAVPVITSAATASATTGAAFRYQIAATNSPTSFGVTGLPGGLTINAGTGVISGAPQTAGKFTLTLNAFNAAGKGSKALTLTVALGPPVITSARTAAGKADAAFSYRIEASGSPTEYGVQGLPGGLTINAKTGLISGTPKLKGTYSLTLHAYNSAGKGAETLTLTIAAEGLPVITSAATAYATDGVAFSYQITASNSPTSFGVQGLPEGLSVNARTGAMSGTSKVAGTYALTLNAYNSTGKGSKTLTLTVAKAGTPVITSAKTAAGRVDAAFSYQIAATNKPSSYGAQGLPGGLSINAATGKISGTPKAAGTYVLTLHAYNAAGKGSANLTLTVAAQ